MPLTPLERRWLFSEQLAKWVLAVTAAGFRVEIKECGILELRKARGGSKFTDGVHKVASLHYVRQAADIELWKRDAAGNWFRIIDGGDPVWTLVGEMWEKQHPLCAWGGRFQDANHLSIMAEDGRK